MDIVSYAKASNAINKIKQTKKELGPNVKKDFSSLDERLDYLERQLEGRYIETDIQAILEAGVFNNTEIVDGVLKLKRIKGNEQTVEGEKGLIPKMISNTSPSGIAQASSIYSISYDAYKAFNKIDNNEGWITKSSLLKGWLSYEFPMIQSINEYSMKSPKIAPYYKEMARDWTLEGFDGVNWVILDKQIKQLFGVNEEKRYKLKNTATFKKYRINVTANNGYGSYTGIKELQFYLKEQAIYASNGTWESEVINFNDSFIELKAILFDEIVSSEHFVKKEIAYSNDGILFSDYEIINNDTLRNEQFIKIRITLTSNDYANIENQKSFSTPIINSITAKTRNFSLKGYMEKVEAKNERDFVELVFKSDTALDAKKNKMESLVVDVFNEDSVENISTKADIKETVLFIKDADIAEGFLKSITIDSLKDIKGVEV